MNIQDRSLAHRRRGWGGVLTYSDRVLAYSPSAYWPLSDAGGDVAACLINSGQNGTRKGNVVLGSGIGPHGGLCSYFPGETGDWIDITTLALKASWSTDAGTMMAWAKVYNAAVWTDVAWRMTFVMMPVTPGSAVYAYGRNDGNNQLLSRVDDGTNDNQSPLTPGVAIGTAWAHFALTWDKDAGEGAGEVKHYLNGVQQGETGTPFVQVGALGSAYISSYNGSQYCWHGWLSDLAYWSSALPVASILDLATV
jgi:hypothetical protein